MPPKTKFFSAIRPTIALVVLIGGAVFLLSPQPTHANSIPLYSFSAGDGANPYAGLVQGNDGNFYGTTLFGGASGYGTVFKITAAGSVTTLYNFSNSDGSAPYAGLVQGSDGNFYGTTAQGGASSYGTVFKITPGGSLTALHSFSYYGDGAVPYAGLVQGNDGNFYGTTFYGGDGGGGTVFKITSGGSLTTLYSFSGNDGSSPRAGLVQGTDGDFYGTTVFGGPSGGGTVFRITSGGSLTTLYSFSAGGHANPEGALVQGGDGNFYGTTDDVGSDTDIGTVFKITPGGSLTTLHSFNYSDGQYPEAALVEGSDGNFYGTTNNGGAFAASWGTVFKITSGGSLTTLYSFSGSDGANPSCALVQGSDGNFYGTTNGGGAGGGGTVFKITVYPANRDQCKDNGWMNFIYPRTFKNQGDCIQFVETGK